MSESKTPRTDAAFTDYFGCESADYTENQKRALAFSRGLEDELTESNAIIKLQHEAINSGERRGHEKASQELATLTQHNAELSAELERAQADAVAVRGMLTTVMASACPNSRDNPTMAAAWALATATLSTPHPGAPLLAELSELRKDRERLDWMECKRWGMSTWINDDAEKAWLVWDNDADSEGGIESTPTLRAAIDAAIAAKEQV